MKGTYTFRYMPDNSTRHIRVEILSSTPKSYKVKYLGHHPNGCAPGYVTFVQRRHVNVDGEDKPARTYTRETRLPYAD